MPLDLETPAQRRLAEELLALGGPRPSVGPDLADDLRMRIERGAATHVGDGAGERLFLSHGAINRLVCDGWVVDHERRGFLWTPQAATSRVGMRAIELDWASRRTADPDRLVSRVWRDLASDTGGLARYLNGLDDLARAAIRHDAEQFVTEVRDTWPPLPPGAHARLGRRVRVAVAGGRVVLGATPDLTLGRLRGDRAGMLAVSFRTGVRRPRKDRAAARFDALLLTLKYGVPPFRWATYYVAEGAWDLEDLDPDVLRSTTSDVVAAIDATFGVRQRAEAGTPVLRAGEHCGWCGQRPTCPVSQAAGTLEA